jgi:hypothetical protein
MWICQGLFPLFQLESLWFHFATSPAILSIFYKIQPNSSQKHRNDAVSQKQLSPRRFSLYFLILSCLKGSTLSLAGAACLAAADTDVICRAAASFVVHAVYRFTVHL